MDDLVLTHEQLRSVVLNALRAREGDQLAELRSSVAKAAERMGLAPKQADQSYYQITGRYEQLSGCDFSRVRNIMWDLIIEGVVRPGLNDGANFDLPFFHLTDWGKAVLKDGPHTPYDPDGYLARLRTEIAALDPVIIAYLTESLRTLRIGCLLSSTITLGCAAEKALLLLVEAYGDSLPQNMAEKFKKNTKEKMIKRQFEELRKMIDSELRSRLPSKLEESLDVELNALFDFIRTQRNAAGHPTGVVIERERAYANLVVFPVYLCKVYSLIDWLKANPKVP